MKLIILLSILIWGSINLNFAEEVTMEVQTNISTAIDHEEFDSNVTTQSTSSTSADSSSVYEFEAPKSELYEPNLGIGLGYRYLGHLNKVGLEKSIYRQFSAGLYIGRFSGKYYGSEQQGVVPGLDHYSLEINVYLNSRKKAFHSGPILKLGAHYNRLKDSGDALQIEVDGQKVIGRGEEKWGPLLGAAYFWQGRYINLTVGSEYFVLGKLKSFVPLTVSLGVAF